MNLQRSIPVVTSIGIILLVAVLRDRSRLVAAIVSTMPINIPLALWVLSAGTKGDSQAMAAFARALVLSLIPSFIWVVIVFLALRAGWHLLASIGVAYAVWAALIAGLFFVGVLRVPG